MALSTHLLLGKFEIQTLAVLLVADGFALMTCCQYRHRIQSGRSIRTPSYSSWFCFSSSMLARRCSCPSTCAMDGLLSSMVMKPWPSLSEQRPSVSACGERPFYRSISSSFAEVWRRAKSLPLHVLPDIFHRVSPFTPQSPKQLGTLAEAQPPPPPSDTWRTDDFALL